MNAEEMLKQIPVMNREWEHWQRVCTLLKETSAVTQEDLEASAFGPYDTKGKDLLEAIRQWGESLADLRTQQR